LAWWTRAMAPSRFYQATSRIGCLTSRARYNGGGNV
jgi:hypothetical protein